MRVRPMREAELEAVADLSDRAFVAVIERLTGQRPRRPFFPLAGLGLRLAADPAGCLVATEDSALVGALFSVARGRLGWFGPLAVREDAQGRGVGQALVAECVRLWTDRGVRTMGLETFPQSPFHAHLYAKAGFQPGWTGVQLRLTLERAAEVGEAASAPPLHHPAMPLPDLTFLLPGFDPTAEVRATLERGAGRVFASDKGLAILHLKDALQTSDASAAVPLLVARDEPAFVSLVAACEEAARAAGKQKLGLWLPGGCWAAFQALVARGYRAGATALRMKRGADLDYDRGAWYADDWL